MKRFVSVFMAIIFLTSLVMAVPFRVAAETKSPELVITFDDGKLHGFTGRNCTVTITDRQAHSGDKSLFVSSGTESYHEASLRVDQYILPDYVYEYTAWIKTDSDNLTDVSFTTNHGSSNDDKEFRWICWEKITSADGWTLIKGRFLYDSSYVLDYIDFNIASAAQSSEYYIDDFSIVALGLSGFRTSALLPSLHEIYSDYFTLGGSAWWFYRDGLDKPMIKRHYKLVGTSINSNAVTSARGVYDFQEVDDYINSLTEMGIATGGAALIWSSDTAEWLVKNDDGSPVTRAKAIENMTEYINEVAGHYSGKLKTWTVVNESMMNGYIGEPDNVISDWRNALMYELHNHPWYGIFASGADVSKGESGADYIELAFRVARKADPYATLQYSDTGLYEADYPKRKAVAEMIKEINYRWLSEGNTRLLIEGIAMQGHYDLTSNPADIDKVVKGFEEAILLFHGIGLQVDISEFNIPMFHAEEYKPLINNDNKINKELLIPTQEMLEMQAELYAKLLILFKKYSAYINSVSFGLIYDAYADVYDYFYAELFDETFNPKLAYFAVADPEGYLAGNFDTAEKRETWIRENSLIPGPRPLIASMDEPAEQQKAVSTLNVSGWALCTDDNITSSIGKIEVGINNSFVEAERFLRADLQKVVKDYGDYSTSGYRAKLNIAGLDSGIYTVTVNIYDKTNTYIVHTITRNIEKIPPAGPLLFCLDRPAEAQQTGNTLEVSGWALYSEDGISNSLGKIEVGVNEPSEIANRFLRTDIKTAFTGYGDYSQSGFDTAIDISSLPAGSHTVVVKIYDKSDVLIQELSRTFVKSGVKELIYHVDLPQENEVISDRLYVSGWVLHTLDGTTSNIGKVAVQAGDTLYTAVPSLREDVKQAVPSYGDYSNCGFAADIDASSLPAGTQEIYVYIYDVKNVQLATIPIKITKAAEKPFISILDLPTEGETATDNLYVYGWALKTYDGITNDIDKIVLSIDTITAEAELFVREDVRSAISGYGDYNNSGFRLNIPLNSLSDGAYTLTVTVYGKNNIAIPAHTRTVNILRESPVAAK